METPLYVFCVSLVPLASPSAMYNYYRDFVHDFRKRKGYLVNYSVVIDAGSTGSRVSVYEFLTPPGQEMEFRSLYYKAITPGLSTYGPNPEECLVGLKHLIKGAKLSIPKDEWPITPLMLRATAGLRLLPPEEAKRILEVITEYFKTTKFKVDDDAVEIMEGKDEGLMAWLSINLILGRLQSPHANKIVALDLGGGSTQVSFLPKQSDLRPEDVQHIHTLMTMKQNYDVYSYSYLGLGINEARRQVIELDKVEHTDKYQSVCIHPKIKKSWMYRGKKYLIRGANTSYAHEGVDLTECLQAIKNVIAEYKSAPVLEGKELYATSYYYFAAVNSGMTIKGRNLVATVSTFKYHAKKVCPVANEKEPFICLDLLYISTLLRKIYSLTNATDINLVYKLKGQEITWTLGAAYMAYQKQLNGGDYFNKQIPSMAHGPQSHGPPPHEGSAPSDELPPPVVNSLHAVPPTADESSPSHQPEEHSPHEENPPPEVSPPVEGSPTPDDSSPPPPSEEQSPPDVPPPSDGSSPSEGPSPAAEEAPPSLAPEVHSTPEMHSTSETHSTSEVHSTLEGAPPSDDSSPPPPADVEPPPQVAPTLEGSPPSDVQPSPDETSPSPAPEVQSPPDGTPPVEGSPPADGSTPSDGSSSHPEIPEAA